MPLEEASFADHDIQLRKGLEVAIIIGAYRQFMDAVPDNMLVEDKVYLHLHNLYNENMLVEDKVCSRKTIIRLFV